MMSNAADLEVQLEAGWHDTVVERGVQANEGRDSVSGPVGREQGRWSSVYR